MRDIGERGRAAARALARTRTAAKDAALGAAAGRRVRHNITGVVTNGLFAHRGADVILIDTDSGVRTLDAHRF